MTDMVTIEWPDNNPPSSDAEFWKQYLTEDETDVKEIIMPKQFKAIKLNVLVEGTKGGGGSGNFGHRGRPGHLGGSVGGTGGGASGASAEQLKHFAAMSDASAKHLSTMSDQALSQAIYDAEQLKDTARTKLLYDEAARRTAAAVNAKPVPKGLTTPEIKMDNRDLVVKNPPKHAAPADEAAAAARINAKLDATQNFSGKPKPAPTKTTSTASEEYKATVRKYGANSMEAAYAWDAVPAAEQKILNAESTAHIRMDWLKPGKLAKIKK